MITKELIDKFIEKNNCYTDKSPVSWEGQCFRRGANSIVPALLILAEALVKCDCDDYNHVTGRSSRDNALVKVEAMLKVASVLLGDEK